jgi:hypothetical protein
MRYDCTHSGRVAMRTRPLLHRSGGAMVGVVQGPRESSLASWSQLAASTRSNASPTRELPVLPLSAPLPLPCASSGCTCG